MDVKYLSVQDIIFIHNEILALTVEDKSLSPDKSIDSAINRIHDHVYYGELQDIFEIAALYATAIAKGHCFNNGNKRTGMVSTVVFLFINDIKLNARNHQIENKIVEIVENKISCHDFSNWLKKHSEYVAPV